MEQDKKDDPIDDQAERLARAEALTPPKGITQLAATIEREQGAAQVHLDEQDDRMARAARGEPFYRGSDPAKMVGLDRWTPDPTTASMEANLSDLANHAELRRRFGEARSLLDRIAKADAHGVEMWREANPDKIPMMPEERAILIPWLLDQLDTATREADDLRRDIARHEKAATPRDSDLELIERLRRDNAALRSKLEGAPRHGKEEIERLHRQIDEITRQRNNAEERFNEANHNHGETSAALAMMTIKWLNLGNEAKAWLLRKADPPPGFKATTRLAAIEEACWRAVEMIAPTSGLPYYSERIADVEVAVESTIVSLLKEVNSLREQLRVADADRVPLARDLQVARDDLKDARESIGRAAPVIDAIRRATQAIGVGGSVGPLAISGALHGLQEVFEAYETACAQAANEVADPSQEVMPF